VVHIVIGIDPGVGGAVAAMYGHGTIIRVDDTPVFWAKARRSKRRVYDVAAMRTLISRHAGHGILVTVFVEHQQAMPKQGVTSMFSTGYGYGLWLGILAGLAIPHTVVAPRRWQAAMLAGQGEPKARALLAAARLFPGCAIPKRRHGRADALLLAEYGRRLLFGAVAKGAAS
jgi:crossover junction endodeoxyribonuclease RuvC